MTRKDYIIIARCIKTELDSYEVGRVLLRDRTIISLVNRLSKAMADDNPQFNLQKFEKACGF